MQNKQKYQSPAHEHEELLSLSTPLIYSRYKLKNTVTYKLKKLKFTHILKEEIRN
jgi:hypothetical protein